MKNFEYTNYAINKANSDAIVYRFANGDVKEITVDDFGGDELAFRTWKAFSDNNYHEEDNHTRSVCRKDISLEAVEEVDLGCSESCLDTFIKTEDDEALREGVEELLSILSPQQRKRLLLYVIEGMKKQDIAVVGRPTSLSTAPEIPDEATNVLSITGSSCYAMTGNGYNDTSGDGYPTGMGRG